MIYSPEEKERMERLLAVFGDYVASSQDMDVAYSEKTGFVRLIIAEDADTVFFPLGGFDEMLEMFFYDVLCDEVDALLARNPDACNADLDYPGLHRKLLRCVSGLDADREYAAEKLRQFIRRRRAGDMLP